jgi:uncharacterized protein YbjT (DUF2867 family)
MASVIAVESCAGSKGRSAISPAAAARALLAAGQPVRALLRDPSRLPGWAAGAEAFAAELTDAAVLTRAFAGAKAAYILVPSNPQVADPMRPYGYAALAVREAALAAGLPSQASTPFADTLAAWAIPA